ncbi:MAG TPA: DUF6119 family protein [Trebonia sp.]|jgi:uncharacterized protein (TIGR04141 family)|nr:DUF6119 family protein [Trebonia sp.]
MTLDASEYSAWRHPGRCCYRGGWARGKTLDPDFRPKKVVFAILMENGKELTADTLYPFSQVTLAHVARVLGTYDIEVEVIGISAA